MMMGAPSTPTGRTKQSAPAGGEAARRKQYITPKGDKAGGDNPPPAFLPKSFFPIPMGAGSYKETFTDI